MARSLSVLRLTLIVVAACGGSTKPGAEPATIENKSTTAGSAEAPAAGEWARVIARSASGGEIEMTSPGGPAFDQAKDHMARHCGAERYIINEIVRRDTGRQTTVDGEPTPEQVYRMVYACVVAP